MYSPSVKHRFCHICPEAYTWLLSFVVLGSLTLLFVTTAVGHVALAGSKVVASSVNATSLSERRRTSLGLYVTSLDAFAAMKQNPSIIFIDVRTKAEFSLVGHPATVHKNIPYANWFDGKLDDKRGNYPFVLSSEFVARIKKHVAKVSGTMASEIFLICRSGGRSRAAVEALATAGFARVWNVVDGFEGNRNKTTGHRDIEGWRHEGLPWSYRIQPSQSYDKL